jgi:hypothetical protein
MADTNSRSKFSGTSFLLDISDWIQNIGCALILVYFVLIFVKNVESFQSLYQGASFDSTDSGSPTPYGIEPRSALNGYGGAYYIRRYRTAIPGGDDARQMQDVTWARQYAPGVGLQLG